MNIENARFADPRNSTVSAIVDGRNVTFAASTDNRVFAEIVALNVEILPFEMGPPSVPQTVSPFQARKVLLDAGLLELVDGFMATAPIEAQIAWEYATVVERGSPFIAQLSTALGLSESEIDGLFVAAGQVA